jgi:hypothetical protein
MSGQLTTKPLYACPSSAQRLRSQLAGSLTVRVPDFRQPRGGPVRGEFRQLLLACERLRVFQTGRNRGVYRDVVFRIDCECCHCFLLAAVGVVTVNHSGLEKWQVKSACG